MGSMDGIYRFEWQAKFAAGGQEDEPISLKLSISSTSFGCAVDRLILQLACGPQNCHRFFKIQFPGEDEFKILHPVVNGLRQSEVFNHELSQTSFEL